jgi:hypothetical protein
MEMSIDKPGQYELATEVGYLNILGSGGSAVGGASDRVDPPVAEGNEPPVKRAPATQVEATVDESPT